jgi:hypothetical protein
MVERENFDKKSGSLGKVLGGDSNIDLLTRLRKTLVDKLVLNTRETPGKPQPEPKKKK